MSKRILAHLSTDATMQALVGAVGAYKLIRQLECHPFETLVRAIAHQQLHATAANNILGRFVTGFGDGAFPTPRIVLATPDAALRAVGFSFAKILAIKDLADKTRQGIVPVRATLVALSDADIIERLTQVRGIGRWTVEMLLIWQLGRPDVFPVDDFGVRNGFRLVYGLRKMPAPKALAAFAQRWAPHRTAAAWYFWRANELQRAGTLPPPADRIRLPRLARRVRIRKARLQRARR